MPQLYELLKKLTKKSETYFWFFTRYFDIIVLSISLPLPGVYKVQKVADIMTGNILSLLCNKREVGQQNSLPL